MSCRIVNIAVLLRIRTCERSRGIGVACRLRHMSQSTWCRVLHACFTSYSMTMIFARFRCFGTSGIFMRRRFSRCFLLLLIESERTGRKTEEVSSTELNKIDNVTSKLTITGISCVQPILTKDGTFT